jgi:hypothetical protein
MKAIVENQVKIGTWTRQQKTDLYYQFVVILNTITVCTNESDLRLLMNDRRDLFEDFIFGFGAHHMWVKQIINKEVKQQVIFVEF